MKQLKQFAHFWYDFVVGDDWRIAASILVLIGLVALLTRRWNVWPLMPLGVALILGASLRRAARASRTR